MADRVNANLGQPVGAEGWDPAQFSIRASLPPPFSHPPHELHVKSASFLHLSFEE